MSSKSSKEWMPAGGIVLEENARNAVISEGNVLVTAGPGSGKTELLAQKACYLLQQEVCISPYRILAISFKGDAAVNLKERVRSRCGDVAARRFDSYTFDGFCKMILDKYRYALPESCRPSRDYVLNDPDRLAEVLGAKRQKDQDRIIDGGTLPLAECTEPNRMWKELLFGSEDMRSSLSFRMVRILAAHILDVAPAVLRTIQSVYQFVFVDEYQDTTPWQYALLGKITGRSSTITAVGDNKQRIMLWAGAMPDAFDRFETDYRPMTTSLLMNHRSAPRLVNLQRLLYDSLGERPLPVKASSRWDPRDGEVQLLMMRDDESETCTVVDLIIQRMRQGTPPEEICILCKQKVCEYAADLEKHLASEGVRICSDLRILDIRFDAAALFLLLFLKKSLGICLSSESARVSDDVSSILERSLDTTFEEHYEDARRVGEAHKRVASILGKGVSAEVFCTALDCVVELFGRRAFAEAFPNYQIVGSLDKEIQFLGHTLFGEYQRCRSVAIAIDSLLGKDVIPAITIHKSKGLEFDYVFFLGLEDSAFWNFKRQKQEDRCAFFVALSRAKKGVAFTFCRQRNRRTQSNRDINEFFEVLVQPGIAEVIED